MKSLKKSVEATSCSFHMRRQGPENCANAEPRALNFSRARSTFLYLSLAVADRFCIVVDSPYQLRGCDVVV